MHISIGGERRQEEGTANRTVASTQMNATSSRAHTVITISFNQITKVAGQERKKESIINLVDLAGSERIHKLASNGKRLQEAKKINLSISAFGNCISALQELSASNTYTKHIPFRDSKLTRLLTTTLGGNAKSCLCANICKFIIQFWQRTMNLSIYM